MARKVLFPCLLGLILASPAFPEESPAFIIRASAGYSLFPWMAFDFDMNESASAGGFTGSLQVYYGDPDGFAFGLEIGFLPIYYGEYTPTYGDTYDMTLAYLPVAVGILVSSWDFYGEMSLGYAFRVGEVRRLTGSGDLSADNFLFLHAEAGCYFFTVDNVKFHGCLMVYAPFTYMLSSLAWGSGPEIGLAAFQVGIKAGLTIMLFTAGEDD
jgi:hypothetical protein